MNHFLFFYKYFRRHFGIHINFQFSGLVEEKYILKMLRSRDSMTGSVIQASWICSGVVILKKAGRDEDMTTRWGCSCQEKKVRHVIPKQSHSQYYRCYNFPLDRSQKQDHQRRVYSLTNRSPLLIWGLVLLSPEIYILIWRSPGNKPCDLFLRSIFDCVLNLL